MTTKELIQQLNRTEDGPRIRRFVDNVRDNGIITRLGRITFTYKELGELFQRCDPSIDATRFEELMQLADAAD